MRRTDLSHVPILTVIRNNIYKKIINSIAIYLFNTVFGSRIVFAVFVYVVTA